MTASIWRSRSSISSTEAVTLPRQGSGTSTLSSAGFDAYNRGDIDGMLENWASDAVLDWSRGLGFDARVYRGRGEIRAFAQRFLATWDEVRFEIVDGPVEIEDGLLITEKLAYLRGRDGIEVQARSAWPGSERVADHDSRRRDDLAHALPDEAGRPRSRGAAGLTSPVFPDPGDAYRSASNVRAVHDDGGRERVHRQRRPVVARQSPRSFLRPRPLRLITIGLFVLAALAPGLFVNGSSQAGH